MTHGPINGDRLKREYNQIVVNGPNAIRYAHEHGKLNMAVMDKRLVAEVTQRPQLPAKVKERVLEKLRELAKSIIDADSDDDE